MLQPLNAARSLPYNRAMSHLDILMPFGLPPAEMATDLLRECKTPALATLLARAGAPQTRTFDVFSRTLPHETWLSQQFFGIDTARTETSPPLAAAAMRQLGFPVNAGTWFMLNPVHIHIARDHLVLTDVRQLAIADEESIALFEAAKPLFDEIGKTLVYGNPSIWFMRADDWSDLQTASPDAACGHNIDIWMPKGNSELAWRKLQNEVQMHWHLHAVNAGREARGAQPVNSLWLWAGAPAQAASVPAPYSAVANFQGWLAAFVQPVERQLQAGNAAEVLAMHPTSSLLLLDSLLAPALANDWGTWLQHMQALETDWFAPLLAALKSGKIKQMKLVMTHSSRCAEFVTGTHSLRKFWAKPSLARLLS